MQDLVAVGPAQVSRTKTWGCARLTSAEIFAAEETNAAKRPSPLKDGLALGPLADSPFTPTERSSVCGAHPAGTFAPDAQIAHVYAPVPGGRRRDARNQIRGPRNKRDETSVAADGNLPSGFAIGRAAVTRKIDRLRAGRARRRHPGARIAHKNIARRRCWPPSSWLRNKTPRNARRR